MKLGLETCAQITVCDWLETCTKLPFFHFVQEGKRSFANGKVLQRMGMKRGVSDLFIPRTTGSFKGVWIEIKIGNNKPTKSQLDFGSLMVEEGYAFNVCYGADEAILVIKSYYCIE